MKPALLTLERSGGSRESDLERRFQLELHEMKDIFELILLGDQIVAHADSAPSTWKMFIN